MEVQIRHLLLRPVDYLVRMADSISETRADRSMLVCAVLCTIQAVKNFDSPIFARMVVSLVATYGVFVASSVLALDPW